MIRQPPISTRTDTLFPYTTLFRSRLIRLSRAVIGIQSNERRRRVIVHRGTEGGDAEPATLACEVREKAAFLLGELYRDDVKGDLLISLTILRHSRAPNPAKRDVPTPPPAVTRFQSTLSVDRSGHDEFSGCGITTHFFYLLIRREAQFKH